VLNLLDHPIQQNVFEIVQDDQLFEHPLALINHEMSMDLLNLIP
jgi:hypothetical protein